MTTRDGGVQCVEAADEQGADQAVLTAEVVVDAHRGDNGFGGDALHGDSVKPVARQHDLGASTRSVSMSTVGVRIRGACADAAAIISTLRSEWASSAFDSRPRS